MSNGDASNQRRDLLDPETLTRLNSMFVQVQRVVEGALTGMHQSRRHGASVEFAEHKEYTPSDDLRFLDWKAYARFDKYYIKKFEAEINLRAWLLLDISKSMAFGEKTSKFQFAATLAASVAYLLLKQQDSVGLMTFAKGVRDFVPARAGLNHLENLLLTMVKTPPDGGTRMAPALSQLVEMAPRRGMILVFSDMLDFDPETLARVKQLAVRKHLVTVFHVLDPVELDFPFDDVAQFRDMENTDRWNVANPRQMRAAYLEEMDRFMDRVKRVCRESDMNYLPCRTDRPPDQVLLEFLQSRGR